MRFKVALYLVVAVAAVYFLLGSVEAAQPCATGSCPKVVAFAAPPPPYAAVQAPGVPGKSPPLGVPRPPGKTLPPPDYGSPPVPPKSPPYAGPPAYPTPQAEPPYGTPQGYAAPPPAYPTAQGYAAPQAYYEPAAAAAPGGVNITNTFNKHGKAKEKKNGRGGLLGRVFGGRRGGAAAD